MTTNRLIFDPIFIDTIGHYAEEILLDPSFITYQIDLESLNTLSLNFDEHHPTYLRQACKKRIIEFCSARLLAQMMLRRHFKVTTSITSLTEKLPQWPLGIKGSISHSQNKVVVVVSTQVHDLGIDIEHWVDQDFAEQSVHLILNQTELRLWELQAGAKLNFVQFLTLSFSIKESLYKAVYEKVQQYIDFLEVHITEIDCLKQKLTLKFDPVLQKKFYLKHEYKGFWRSEEDYVLTWITDV